MPNFDLKAVITAEDKASKTIKGLGDNFNDLGKRLGRDFKYGAIAAGAAIAGFGITSVKAFEESQNAIAQTNAVLKSTGGIAGVTGADITILANKMQKLTRYSDEQVRSGMNMLLTFTKINKDVFPEATRVILDMSTALGQDLQSSAIQLGKALQDPILGITALRRVGVNFGEAEKEMITKMVEAGNIMDAQKFILKELQTEFGGSAVAAGQTFAGSIDRLKNAFNDLQETIGGAIITAIVPYVEQLTTSLIPQTDEFATKTEGLTRKIQSLMETIIGLILYWKENRNELNIVIGLFLTLAAIVNAPIAG